MYSYSVNTEPLVTMRTIITEAAITNSTVA